ncbi:hypothetical protein F3I16_15135 [Pseudomonas sp. L-22-4S-12]|uniref:hypothetical protein n=1 Tax=Pseudomonas sp. L-22-4S-12 TaxID=2610893 RepID=UPI001321B415|nr:hypothetical protein [Pseudomonas sp. L-22-4S-12]MWV17376.1 hypothetical protein [Pseudomonas sp. L-22-4S-12]
MSLAGKALSEQRLALRRRLFLQRLRIAHLLTPAAGANGFPRSMTMRLLTQRPAVAMRLLSEVGLLLLGPRLIRTLGTGLLLARIVRAVATDSRRLPPPR